MNAAAYQIVNKQRDDSKETDAPEELYSPDGKRNQIRWLQRAPVTARRSLGAISI